ncbi:MAG: bifunctional folylpolyglutamate synthase/dihydrofolate synthase [Bacteroidales bacterium]|nr:bifunctional folylpolyglutamate synthase/dihydrofolate synthase [Bacteroidales bacterium]MCM1414809.1 bifunctional folylpolyglutamate synthase/dihydrofolate synthase [bacterium]MCM1422440.1 bifunctional folylpolyglutamate synthase/dihydrofolate synthase [bacterium]
MKETYDTYGAAVNYLSAVPKFTSKNDMEDTKRFLAHLGSPAQDRKILHVAGTNGKGSVCAYLCSVLQKAGISCGMFTSPHLVSMRERFRINGEIVSEERFLRAFLRVMEALERLPKPLAQKAYHPTFFEFLFFMAMLLFEEAEVEYLVLETGLGGRLDATNAVERKELCVITSIGYDHMEYLGDTLPEIAAEKAGILRKDVPVVYPKKQEEVREAIESCIRKCGAKSCPLEEDAIKEIKIKHKTIDFSLHFLYYDYIGFTVSTSALYQVENASLAVRALSLLREERITEDVLRDGIRAASWEGRMEEILPSVYVDGAHNIDGIRAFLTTVGAHPCAGKRILLYSSVRDKQYREAAKAIAEAGLFARICPVQMQGERALPLAELAESFARYDGFEMTAYDTLERAFTEQAAHKNEQDAVYLVGSLYLAGEMKALLRSVYHDQF